MTTVSESRPSAGRIVRLLTVGVPLTFMLVAFVYPLANILATGLASEGGALKAFGDVFTRPSLRGVAWFTLWQATCSPATSFPDDLC